MDIELPAIPAGILTLLAFFAPYAQAVLQRPEWSPSAKKIASVAAAFVLTGIVVVLYYVLTGDAVPSWPVLVLLTLTVSQSSYALVTRDSSKRVEDRTSTPRT